MAKKVNNCEKQKDKESRPASGPNWGFWVVMGIIVILLPIGLQRLMTWGWLSNTPGGSNDGWLGFWGSYLGIPIAIGGVYWQSIKERELTKEEAVVQARPHLDFSIQYNIEAGNYVYHSSNTIMIDDYRGFFYKLRNISQNPALDILFCIYVKGEDKPQNILSIQGIEDESILIAPSLEKNQVVSKIDIFFRTSRDEYGSIKSVMHDESIISLPARNYGKEPHRLFDEAVQMFDGHNRENKGSLINIWNQYQTYFNADMVKSYDNLSKKLYKADEDSKEIERKLELSKQDK
ncbi:hypothetical protein [Levilactobacillus enshiensis]|nr:hypothetical protein [Levilactobacillus enshiensis]